MKTRQHQLDSEALGDQIDRLYRAARCVCSSRREAEELVRETFARVAKKPRRLGPADDLPDLLRVLRNTFTARVGAGRPQTLLQSDAIELVEAATVPPPEHRHDPGHVIATRLHHGRQRIALMCGWGRSWPSPAGVCPRRWKSPTSRADLDPDRNSKRSASELFGVHRWANTPGGEPLTLGGLSGRMVLIEFWPFACRNCRRTLPFPRRMHGRYLRDLVVVGVHTPKLRFERPARNVKRAEPERNLEFPVGLDNDYAAWSAFGPPVLAGAELGQRRASRIRSPYGRRSR